MYGTTAMEALLPIIAKRLYGALAKLDVVAFVAASAAVAGAALLMMTLGWSSRARQPGSGRGESC